ncbi:unnamed protein product [Bursaphelenchus okinawaensis]|uniref:Uncharacterized protein n=1 Tax=Bursaphelenchus okinawaensis TaxID=465554 RepID=A0A811K3E7_9BILA|nr:unnamed protein product [Bursaphelenchus okinawaensis]CAG9090537.1 unnamed protein product [Bursaphelenchus okinawaensis]
MAELKPAFDSVFPLRLFEYDSSDRQLCITFLQYNLEGSAMGQEAYRLCEYSEPETLAIKNFTFNFGGNTTELKQLFLKFETPIVKMATSEAGVEKLYGAGLPSFIHVTESSDPIYVSLNRSLLVQYCSGTLGTLVIEGGGLGQTDPGKNVTNVDFDLCEKKYGYTKSGHLWLGRGNCRAMNGTLLETVPCPPDMELYLSGRNAYALGATAVENEEETHLILSLKEAPSWGMRNEWIIRIAVIVGVSLGVLFVVGLCVYYFVCQRVPFPPLVYIRKKMGKDKPKTEDISVSVTNEGGKPEKDAISKEEKSKTESKIDKSKTEKSKADKSNKDKSKKEKSIMGRTEMERTKKKDRKSNSSVRSEANPTSAMSQASEKVPSQLIEL